MNIKIFLDLDDTLANTSDMIGQQFGIKNYRINDKVHSLRNFSKVLKAWKTIKTNPQFWQTVVPTEHAFNLYQECLKISDDMHVLTAVPSWLFKKDHYFHEAEKSKKLWLKEYFPNIDKVWVGYAKEKHLHILKNEDCILLDDSRSNIVLWKNAGGIAIHIDEHNMNLAFEKLNFIQLYRGHALKKDFYQKFNRVF